MHLQVGEFEEAKLVRCLEGAVFDVVVDLRRDSCTFGHWYGLELSQEKSNALIIPEGCAHGFQVLNSDSQLLYIHSERWIPENETGIRWNDPKLKINWPLPVTKVSDRDLNLPFL